jgi:hypothetical protein
MEHASRGAGPLALVAPAAARQARWQRDKFRGAGNFGGHELRDSVRLLSHADSALTLSQCGAYRRAREFRRAAWQSGPPRPRGDIH